MTFESEHLHLTLYTAGTHPTCTAAGTGLSCFEPTLDIWQMIAGTNPHGSLTPNPREQTDGQCVACHTLSRHGNRLAADVGGEKLWVVEVSPTYPPPRIVTVDPMNRRIDSTWATFSFDESRIVSSARGILTLRAADTGANNDTNNYPSFSWDSQWIAYVHSTASGKNDVTSDLWLMGRDGTAPRALTRANTIINAGVVTTPTVQDNMPTWAPSQAADDYAWVAFSSTRNYGGVLGGTSHLGSHEQIWVALVDLTQAAGTSDPSFPAFRLPAQDLDEDTHRPFWAEDRVMIPMSNPDAGVPACVPQHGDCEMGVCCTGFTCTPDSSGNYTCEIVAPG